jgi:hypothetical protein
MSVCCAPSERSATRRAQGGPIRSSLSPMSPVPGEPLDPKPDELTTSDGRKFKVKVPGLAPPPKPGRTEERGSAEPPREDPRPLINPDHIGP